GEGEQRLEEARGDDHRREQTEVKRVQLTLRQDGREEPESDREIDARRGSRAAPDKRQARQSGQYSGRRWPSDRTRHGPWRPGGLETSPSRPRPCSPP